jgi:PAS domain S-box-containing protein
VSRNPKEQPRKRHAKSEGKAAAIKDRLFQAAFHNSPAMQSIVRFPDAILVQVNDTFTRTLGYTPQEILGKTPFELNFWVVPEKLQSYREQLETKSFVRDYEVEVRAKDGSIRTMLLSSDLVDIDGVPHSVSAGVDITARKRSEKIQQATYQISEAAHAAEDLSSLYAHIHQIIKGLMPADNFYIALFDLTTELISFPYFVDERSEKPQPFPPDTGLTGYVLRTGKALLIDGDMNARKERLGDKVTFKGFEEICYVESGKPAATWLGVPLTIQGKPIGVMAVQDYRNGQAYGAEEKRILAFVATQTALAIDRKRGQQALQESEQKFRALFEGSSQGVMIQDEEKFLEINPATLRILGFTRAEELLGKHPKDNSPLLQPNGETSESAARRHINECMAKGSARFDWLGLNAREEPVLLEVILTRVELGGRKVIQAVINDITERKRAEAELHKALEKERELGQLKSDFVSLVSHEFRTPLEIIMSSVDNLDRYHDRLTAEKREHLLRTINKSVRRMSTMMEEVLVLGRLETDRMTFKSAAFDLRAFCQRVCDEIESATANRCSIHLHLNSVPDQAFGDEAVLRHIFTNLLSNAVKYSTPGQAVEFLLERKGDEGICRIVDRGCGIPESDQKRLFQAFHRGSNVRQIPGTGLGLLIVQRCVDLHGGEIQFESMEGRGTTFAVRLPLFAQPSRNTVGP